MLRLAWETISLATTFPFAIARWGYAGHQNVIVTVTDDDGMTGIGEAAPNRYYGESVDSVIAALERYADVLRDADPEALEANETALLAALRGNTSARAALSTALHDLCARRLGLPVYRLWGLSASPTPVSSYTVGIADDAGIRARVLAAADYPILKIKLGTDRDEAILEIVRDAAPHKRLRVDANAAWTPSHAVQMASRLQAFGVEMLEQPVSAHDIDGLRYVRERSPIPVVADESCLVATDIPRLAGACDGINIKLAKCGSLREAMRMIHVARAHGMRVMAGCMIESSVGISAIAQLAPLLDDADFDGAALLADDPYTGVTIPNGVVTLTTEPGIGARRRHET